MNIVFEYKPTDEYMDYAFHLEIDIVQRLSIQNLLHLLGPGREFGSVTRDEDVFEVKIDDLTIFSKESLGRLPNGEEVVNYIASNT